MIKNSPTIYDVAREAGVSIATVSRAINYPQRVNPETRARIIQAMDKLAYVGATTEKAKLSHTPRRIGVLIPFFTEPSFTQRLRGIASVLSQHNLEMVILPVDTKGREQSYLQTIPIRRTVDGLIIVSQQLEDATSKRLLENHLETVIIEFNDPHFSSLEINDTAGGKLATQYLIEKGHRRIAFMGGRSAPTFGINPIARRLAGYLEAMDEAKLVPEKNLVHEYAMDIGTILRAMTRERLPLAIFAATDLQAIAILREARVMGLRVPQDMAVIGFDDIDMAAFFGLTTIHQPLDESGRIAAKILVSRLENPSQTIQHIEFPLKVIERESV